MDKRVTRLLIFLAIAAAGSIFWFLILIPARKKGAEIVEIEARVQERQNDAVLRKQQLADVENQAIADQFFREVWTPWLVLNWSVRFRKRELKDPDGDWTNSAFRKERMNAFLSSAIASFIRENAEDIPIGFTMPKPIGRRSPNTACAFLLKGGKQYFDPVPMGFSDYGYPGLQWRTTGSCQNEV